VIGTPFVYVAMAKEGLFFERFGDLHARTRAPVLAVVFQCAITLAYLLVVGEDVINDLTGTVVFAEWIFHALVALGLLLLVRRRPDMERPFRAPGGPLFPILYFVLASALVIGNLVQGDAQSARKGLAVVAVGALVYHPWRALVRNRRAQRN
jgi:APA family basic amino acid/polyamine antiporter